MSFTKAFSVFIITVAAALAATGCRQFKELVNEEPKSSQSASAKQSVQSSQEDEELMLQNPYLNDVERAEIEAAYGDREAERKARRKRVFGF